VVIVEV